MHIPVTVQQKQFALLAVVLERDGLTAIHPSIQQEKNL